MEKPRLRWIDAQPIVHDGTEMILLRDTEGIGDRPLIVSKATAYLLSLMDGTRSFDELQREYLGASGETVPIEKIREIVEAMDASLFLMNDNFDRHYASLREDYEKAAVRASCLAGRSYPDDMQSLLAFLDEMLSVGDHLTALGDMAGILAPHIDYGRGQRVYKHTYRYLKETWKPLIVLFGTSHGYTEKMWNISLKDFATPLGVIPSSAGLCEMISSDKVLRGFVNEWPHRNEHSIELQLPIIQFLTAGKPVEILPILTGSMHEYIGGGRSIDEDEMTAPLESLKELLQVYGKPYLVIAGADLAHIGAQFGDPYLLDLETMTRSKKRDAAILDCIRNVDARGFFEEIKSEDDRRRICGLTPIFFQLYLLQGSRCEIVDYDQWYDGRSSVSFAGGIFYGDR